jgi:hypothetical protein
VGQTATGFGRFGDVHRRAAFVDISDLALFIDHERRPVRDYQFPEGSATEGLLLSQIPLTFTTPFIILTI